MRVEIGDSVAVPRNLRRRDNVLAGAQQTQGPGPPGQRPDSFYRLAVGAATLRLHDRASLEFNVLTQLASVRRLAEERHQGKIWRRGLCLRDLLDEAIHDTIEAADGVDMERLRFVLTRAASGNTLTNIAAHLGVRRESLSRGIWSCITALVWERLNARLMALEP
jgi:hypothetical protein